MRIQKSFQLALNILIHSRLRSWLTIIGIVIGVAAIVAIVSIGEGAQANVNSRLGGLGADIITVSPGFSRASGEFGGFGGGGGGATTGKNLTSLDIQIIKSVPGVLYVDGIVSGRADVSYLTETASISVEGVDPFAWTNMLTTNLASGRLLQPSDANDIVIGYNVANTVFKEPIPLNRLISVQGKPFRVIGILASSGTRDDSTIFMTVADARNTLTTVTDKQRFDSISVKVADANQATDIANAIDAKLMISRHVTNKTKDYTVTSPQATQARIASITSTFTLFLAAIAAASLLVGAVGVANTMFTSVLEKTREIGILKAIGAKNSDIMAIFLLNSALVGFVGGLIGVILGAGLSYLLPNVLGLRLGPGGHLTTVLPMSLLLETLALSVIIGMVAGAIPAYRASKLKPVDALRYE